MTGGHAHQGLPSFVNFDRPPGTTLPPVDEPTLLFFDALTAHEVRQDGVELTEEQRVAVSSNLAVADGRLGNNFSFEHAVAAGEINQAWLALSRWLLSAAKASWPRAQDGAARSWDLAATALVRADMR